MGLWGGLNLLHTDYNNDGHADVLILRGAWLNRAGHHPNSLLKNNGDGTFEDVTEAAGLLSFHPTQAAAWLDFDGDGWVDLFIGNESTATDPHASELFRNNRDGTFTECAAKSGVAVNAFVKAVVTGDFNNDRKPDLYLSCLSTNNMLFINGGGTNGIAWRFKEIAREAGVSEPIHSFSSFVFDYDNDGWQDLYVSGYGIRGVGDIAADYLNLNSSAERSRLFRNNGNGTFADVSIATGLHRVSHGMGINFGDLDNDGWLDFYVGTGDPNLMTIIPNRMFRNSGGQFFQEVTSAGGFGHLQKGHAISFTDLDNDGDQDVFAMMGGAYRGDVYRDALFLNPGFAGNQFVNLKLEGRSSNRAAIGARIHVTARTPKGPRHIHRVVSTGGSFGASAFRQEIGLGKATLIENIQIEWPATGKTQTFSDIQLGQFYKIIEDDPIPHIQQVPRFQLANAKPGIAPHTHSHP